MLTNSSNIMRFLSPASWWGEKWRDGLLTGNGTIGANVYGGAVSEKVLINHADLRWQGRVHVLPDVSLKIKELRRKQDIGDFVGAQTVLPNALTAKRFAPSCDYPLPLGELSIKMLHSGLISQYTRQVDMNSGEVSVEYYCGGTRYTRDTFVSRDNDLVVINMTKQGSSPINAEYTFGRLHRVNANTQDGISVMPEGISVETDKGYLYYSAKNDDGTEFGTVIRFISPSGVIKNNTDSISISNSNSVMILLATFVSGNKDRDWARLKTKLSAVKESYDRMLRAHSSIHNKLFGSVTVDLTKDNDEYTEKLLLNNSSSDLSPLLVEKLYKLGRYLHVCGNANNGRLFSPVGLWNGNYKAHRSEINYGGDMELTYLHALQGNLVSNIESTFDTFENNIADYQNNAMRLYGCKGIFVPTINAPNTGRLGSNDSFAIHYTGCGAWLSNFYYKYAKQYNNTKFLKRLVPFMKEVALFYEDFFVVKDTTITVAPSALYMRLHDSERIIDRPVIAKNSTHDIELARHLFVNLISACKELSIHAKDVKRWESLLGKLPNSEISGEEIYKEFINSSISVDYSGISVGTLYPCYFADGVNFLSSEDEIAQYEHTADKKLQELSSQNSYNVAILSSVYARLGNFVKAKQCISICLRACSTANLTFVDKDWRGMGLCGSGTWTPVQMQTNMIIANTIQQMLMYSTDELVSILHATPQEWKDVEVEGMISAGGIEVSFVRNSTKETLDITLLSKKAVVIDLYLPQTVKKFVKKSEYTLTRSAGKKVIKQLQLQANRQISLSIKI